MQLLEQKGGERLLSLRYTETERLVKKNKTKQETKQYTKHIQPATFNTLILVKAKAVYNG